MTSRATGGKLIRDINDEHQAWLDQQPLTITCTLCGSTSTGPAKLMLALAAQHRQQLHPNIPPAREALAARQRQLAEKPKLYAVPSTRPAAPNFPLGPTQQALLELLDNGPMRISDLAQHRGVAMGAIGKTLAGLRKRGLVVKQRRGLYARADHTATVEAA